MIDDAIDYIRREVEERLTLDSSDVHLGNIHVLKDQNNNRGLYMSVVNLEEETTLRNTSHVVRQNNSVRYQEPPVFLNTYLLFAADFSDYAASLLRLSQTIELFQSQRVFDAAHASATNAFPATLEKLVFDFTNLNFEQLNHMWGVLGGTYLPSVLYKVRVVKIQLDETVSGPEITTIHVETSVS
jgi:hypothetical protein